MQWEKEIYDNARYCIVRQLKFHFKNVKCIAIGIYNDGCD